MNASLYSFVLIILLIRVDCQLLRRRPGDVCAGCPVEQSPYDRDVRLAAFAAIRQLGPGHRLLWIYRAQTGVVAGTAYYLWMKILKFGRPKYCTAKVWHKLDGTRELSETTC